MTGDEPTSARPARTYSRRRLAVTAVVSAVLSSALTLGIVAAWALNRYVVDHVAITDVSAFEAKQLGSTTTTSAATTTALPRPTASAAATTPSTVATTTTAAAPVLTDTSYDNGSTQIEIDKVVNGTGPNTITYFVADVKVANASELRSAFAENKFGENIIANTSEIAADVGALLAINGDYYGYRKSGIIVRNGVAYRDKGARQGFAIFADGTAALYDETATNADALVARGVIQTLSFGPGILDKGDVVPGLDEVEIDTNIGNHSIQGAQPRTGIGWIGPNHFVFVVVDGRSTGYSRGVTLTEFARLFQSLGASVAYNLDGGGSTTMVFNNKVVNNPLGKGRERGTSDILFLKAP